jgi:hypothetical protein
MASDWEDCHCPRASQPCGVLGPGRRLCANEFQSSRTRDLESQRLYSSLLEKTNLSRLCSIDSVSIRLETSMRFVHCPLATWLTGCFVSQWDPALTILRRKGYLAVLGQMRLSYVDNFQAQDNCRTEGFCFKTEKNSRVRNFSDWSWVFCFEPDAL